MSTTEHKDPTVDSSAPPQAPEAAHIEQHSTHTSPPPAAQIPDAQGPPPIIVNMHQPTKKHSFAEEVVGYAKEIRGTLLRQPETKEMGEKILKGEVTYNPKEPAE